VGASGFAARSTACEHGCLCGGPRLQPTVTAPAPGVLSVSLILQGFRACSRVWEPALAADRRSYPAGSQPTSSEPQPHKSSEVSGVQALKPESPSSPVLRWLPECRGQRRHEVRMVRIIRYRDEVAADTRRTVPRHSLQVEAGGTRSGLRTLARTIARRDASP